MTATSKTSLPCRTKWSSRSSALWSEEFASSGAEQSGRKPTQLWAAHDYFLQGRARSIQFNSLAAAQFLRRAIELDPAHAQAHAWLAGTAYVLHSDHGRREDLEEGLRTAQTAVRLDPLDSSGHRNLGLIYSKLRQYELGGIHLDRAVALNPNDVYASTFRGLWLAFTGRGEEALRSLEADLRRDPFPPSWYLGVPRRCLPAAQAARRGPRSVSARRPSLALVATLLHRFVSGSSRQDRPGEAVGRGCAAAQARFCNNGL